MHREHLASFNRSNAEPAAHQPATSKAEAQVVEPTTALIRAAAVIVRVALAAKARPTEEA